ncbi:FAD-dependent monooxygenase [Agrobacterium sp. LMR679]|uniref:FAD-dependent monooxygenase n=1 Tax=Agrobacterium sp. LMR679 TaxID=3014335 RepID=UPI0022B06117|nr:FAD-dependent monooxygenase [Agrobacterium sp. LMR679]MCZ4072133.1 FAD-dependent monooxygenase [Agrobacterium sp. LMR679]
MKIAVVGGGPAGLYFASSLKGLASEHNITVFEKSPGDSTYGFGIAFSDGALKSIGKADPKLCGAILAHSERLDTLTIVHHGQRVPVSGNVFFGISRLRLLELLADKALSAGVQIVRNLTIGSISELEDFDLVVGADGVNSLVRRQFVETFEPEATACRNLLIWYACERTTDGIELLFHQTEFGLFVGHTYRYQSNRNTFVIECSPSTWRKAGLDKMAAEQSRAFCSALFTDFLKGGHFIANRSVWFTPKLIRTKRWSHQNIGLIGDALKTLHPSVGSGTRAAMKDAFALARACAARGSDPHGALALFEAEHREGAEDLQQSALHSIEWYETVEDKLDLAPVQLAFDYMMRTGKVNSQRLRQMDASFADAWESAGRMEPSDIRREL